METHMKPENAESSGQLSFFSAAVDASLVNFLTTLLLVQNLLMQKLMVFQLAKMVLKFTLFSQGHYSTLF